MGNSYTDDPDEVYSRLMELRRMNKLDPKKTYTIDDIKKLRDSGKDFNILKRYDDTKVLKLLNEVAQVKTGASGGFVS